MRYDESAPAHLMDIDNAVEWKVYLTVCDQSEEPCYIRCEMVPDVESVDLETLPSCLSHFTASL